LDISEVFLNVTATVAFMMTWFLSYEIEVVFTC
jgi:hypothetical protein